MNYDESLVDLVRTMLVVTMKIATPLLGAGVIIGLVISVLQAITSIQDQALSFVPKIVGMILVAILLLPWILRRLLDFATEMLGSLHTL